MLRRQSVGVLGNSSVQSLLIIEHILLFSTPTIPSNTYSSCISEVELMFAQFYVLFQPPYSGLNKQLNQGQYEINFLIHSSQAGSIIGTGGIKIKELREVLQLFVVVHKCNDLHY